MVVNLLIDYGEMVEGVRLELPNMEFVDGPGVNVLASLGAC